MKIRYDNVKASWKPFFDSHQAILKEIENALSQCEVSRLCPSPEAFFKAFELTCLNEFKVLVLSQDPYIRGEACGLAFSTATGFRVPPSLRNIFTEIYTSMDHDNSASTGDLTPWCREVLLLNSALSTEFGKAGSHRHIWKDFSNALIDFISQNRRDFVMLAWGKHAHKVAERLDDITVIKTSHPSPLGCYKSGSDFVPFSGSDCFNQANIALLDIGHAPVSWVLL